MPGSHDPILRNVLENYKSEIVLQLNANTTFLTTLARHKFIPPEDIIKYERIDDSGRRNRELIKTLLNAEIHRAAPGDYDKFMEALKRSGQEKLAAMMTTADKENALVDKYYKELDTHLHNITSFLTTEIRRANLALDDDVTETAGNPSSSKDGKDSSGPPSSSREALTDFLFRIHHTTRATLVQFDRCRAVMDKLHQDCDDVAKKHADQTSRVSEAARILDDIRQQQGLTGARPWSLTELTEEQQAVVRKTHDVNDTRGQHTQRSKSQKVSRQFDSKGAEVPELHTASGIFVSARHGSVETGKSGVKDYRKRALSPGDDSTGVQLTEGHDPTRNHTAITDGAGSLHETESTSSLNTVSHHKRGPAVTMVKQLQQLKEMLNQKDIDEQRCVLVLNNMLVDVRQRREAMTKGCGAGLSPIEMVENRYTSRLPNLEHGFMTAANPIRAKLDELSQELCIYMEHQKQVARRAELGRLQETMAKTHRNFNQADKRLILLQRELKRNDKDKALAVAVDVIQASQTERDQCLNTMQEMERLVHARCTKLQEAASSSPSVRMLRRRPSTKQRAIEPGQVTISSLSKRLELLKTDVKKYLELEMDLNQKHKANVLRQKLDYDKTGRRLKSETRDIEKRLRDVQNERDKYKRLYDQERNLTLSRKLKQEKIVRRPMAGAVGRDTRGSNSIHSKPGADGQKERRAGKPKLTPRARNLMWMREGPPRQTVTVRPLQLMPEYTEQDDGSSHGKQHDDVSRTVAIKK